MFRLWGIIRKNNKNIHDIVASSDDKSLSKEEKFHECVETICKELDLERPLWLQKNQKEYYEFQRVELNQDNFIEPINFDSLVLEVIEDK